MEPTPKFVPLVHLNQLPLVLFFIYFSYSSTVSSGGDAERHVEGALERVG